MKLWIPRYGYLVSAERERREVGEGTDVGIISMLFEGDI